MVRIGGLNRTTLLSAIGPAFGRVDNMGKPDGGKVTNAAK